jgi:dUTP pyrophosphatase
MKEIKVELLREGAKPPERAHPTDAGMDVFASLEYAPNYKVIAPSENKLIPTGIKMNIPEGYVVEVKNRSSIASKRCLVVGAHIIDSGYQGEIFIDLHNIGSDIEMITHGEKIAQLVCYPIATPQPVVVENAFEQESERGEGGFGSTDN